jgi:filamentous hemagglutinin family protein
MIPIKGSWRWQLLASALIVGCVASSGNFALGQVVEDTTLGAESSLVTSPTPGGFQIDGGATRGTNLFHSFSEFSIPRNGSAFFNNALTIENIISRVTGTSGSNINGAIRANGTANLFLINPNGIVFGPNASLNIRGSFLASTARGLLFDNGFEFSATNPQAPPLLTINVPIGLQTGANPGRIVNQSRANGNGLEVQPGRTLALVGGEVAIEGGILYAPDGRIELGSVAGNSLVSLTPTDTGYALGYEGVENFQDIRLTREAIVNTSGDSGGSIQVQGRNLTLTDGSQIFANTLGAGKGEGLSVNASESVQLIGTAADDRFPSGLFAQVGRTATGEAGELRINTRKLLVRDGAQATANTLGAGKGGSLIIDASEWVQVIGRSADGRSPSRLSAQANDGSTGDAGNLTITTGQLLVRDGAGVSAITRGAGKGGSLMVNASEVQVIGESADRRLASALSVQAGSTATGDAGDLTINTQRLLVRDGGQVDALTNSAGKGGNLIVNASESVHVIGTSAGPRFTSNLTVQAGGRGDAGDLSITTPRLLVLGGGQVDASTWGAGKGGSLIINAFEVQVIGSSIKGQFLHPSGLFAKTEEGTGDAGDIRITTRQLLVRDGARVDAATFGTGKGGNLTVHASEEIQLIGTSAQGRVPSGLFVNATVGSTAGNLNVATGQMSVRDGAQVRVSSPTGQAGNMTITADSLTLNRGRLFAETGKSTAEGGANITLQNLDLLRMDNESLISANALEDANGGNVTIDSTLIVATPPKGSRGSDITANAVRGNGGRVNITTQGLFGIEFRPKLTPYNDITASSDFGIAGEVAINTPDVDPSRGLTELPSNVVDATESIARSCTPASRTGDRSSFTITGRGGLPLSPYDPLQGRSVVVDWVTLDPQVDNRSSNDTSAPPTAPQTPTVTEAQGWMYGSKGEVILTAQASNVTPQSPTLTPATCSSW